MVTKICFLLLWPLPSIPHVWPTVHLHPYHCQVTRPWEVEMTPVPSSSVGAAVTALRVWNWNALSWMKLTLTPVATSSILCSPPQARKMLPVTIHTDAAPLSGRSSNLSYTKCVNLLRLLHKLAGLLGFLQVGGGTGTEFTFLLIERNVLHTQPCGVPPVEALCNSILTRHSTLKYSACTFRVNSEASCDICHRKFHMETPTSMYI